MADTMQLIKKRGLVYMPAKIKSFWIDDATQQLNLLCDVSPDIGTEIVLNVSLKRDCTCAHISELNGALAGYSMESWQGSCITAVMTEVSFANNGGAPVNKGIPHQRHFSPETYHITSYFAPEDNED